MSLDKGGHGSLDKAQMAKAQNVQDSTADTGTNAAQNVYYSTYANLATIDSQTVTTTKQCLVIVVAFNCNVGAGQGTKIQRGAVDKTALTTISAVNFASTGLYGHLQYATELLPPGTYQYDLINTSGGALGIAGHAMQIIAVSDV